MIQMNLHQVTAIVGGSLVGKEARIQGVTTDSRGSCQGQLFVALRGEFFNGEDFCQAAVEQGAAAVMVANAVEVEVPQIIVKDTLVALQALASAWVKQTGVKVIAVTGSNGKTTVKNMLEAVLSQKYKCFATSGNYNNEIGVPLSLLAISKSHDVAVIEMGAAQVGDIAHLTKIIKPDIALITNVGEAHVGRFGSEANIAKGKAEIYQALAPDDLAVVNLDSPYANSWLELISSRVQTFGVHADAHFRLVKTDDGFQVLTRRDEAFELSLPVLGDHNYMNATAVVAIALNMRLSFADIQQGLNTFIPEAGRLALAQAEDSGLQVIDDSYNANPASVNAAIDVLKGLSKPTLLILGDMAELGEYAPQMHQNVGQYAADQGIDQIWAVGEFAEHICHENSKSCQPFQAVDELITHLGHHQPVNGTVLVKGSRSMRLERVVAVLLKGGVA